MKSSRGWRIFTPSTASTWIRLGSLFLLLELWQRFLHPFHGASSESLRILFGVCAIICYLLAVVSGPNFVASFLRKRRNSIESP
jgi:uncharacterized membrane protein